MEAIIIANDLYDYLNDSKEEYGKVHSVFKNTINLISRNDNLISIFADTKDIAPMSLVLSGKIDTLFIFKDMDVIFYKDKIEFPDINKAIKFKNANKWNSTPETGSEGIRKSTYQRRLNLFEKTLFENGNKDGILDTAYCLYFDNFDVKPVNSQILELNGYCQFIFERIQLFLESVSSKDKEESGESLKKIIGFGPGLTPSVDDFVAGLMVGSYYLAAYYGLNLEIILEFNNYMFDKSIGKTTTISEAMLKLASTGLASRKYKEVLLALLFRPDLKITAAVNEALDFGETSGTDFLYGVFVANRMFLKKEIREAYNDC